MNLWFYFSSSIHREKGCQRSFLSKILLHWSQAKNHLKAPLFRKEKDWSFHGWLWSSMSQPKCKHISIYRILFAVSCFTWYRLRRATHRCLMLSSFDADYDRRWFRYATVCLERELVLLCLICGLLKLATTFLLILMYKCCSLSSILSFLMECFGSLGLWGDLSKGFGS